jgi:hypothetical protein
VENGPMRFGSRVKDSMHHLQDILCDIPGLIEDATKIQGSALEPSNLASQYESISENILIHLGELYKWRSAWQRANPSACHEAPTAFDSPADTQILFPTVLCYSTLTAANEITLYNAIS